MLRPAVPKDLPAVNRLLGEVLHVHNGIRPDLFRPEGKKYADAELIILFSNPDAPVYVYEKDGEVLGYVFLEIRHQDSGSLQALSTLYIDDLCVDSAHRGEGIGRILYEKALEIARERGCHNVTLHVWEGNDEARGFYEHLGMKPQFTSMETVL
jgi:ribosomal protein S18 acetylase RimI-like enzyme